MVNELLIQDLKVCRIDRKSEQFRPIFVFLERVRAKFFVY